MFKLKTFVLNNKRIALSVSISLVVVGIFGWSVAIFFNDEKTINEYQLSNVEFPLGELKGIVVDNEGNIYCGLQSYGRIQVYNEKGKFIKGTFIDAQGGDFKIMIDNDENIHIATIRKGMHYIYKKNLSLATKTSNSQYYFQIGEKNDLQAADKNNNLYQIKYNIIYPTIIKISPSGEENKLISTPLYLWPIMFPLPAWLIGATGFIFSWLILRAK